MFVSVRVRTICGPNMPGRSTAAASSWNACFSSAIFCTRTAWKDENMYMHTRSAHTRVRLLCFVNCAVTVRVWLRIVLTGTESVVCVVWWCSLVWCDVNWCDEPLCLLARVCLLDMHAPQKIPGCGTILQLPSRTCTGNRGTWSTRSAPRETWIEYGSEPQTGRVREMQTQNFVERKISKRYIYIYI